MDGGLCFFHANPNKASELGRIGGRKNGRGMVGSDPLPLLDTITAVRDAGNRVISDVYAGNLHPRTAAGLAPLLQLQLRAIEKIALEDRMTTLEEKVARVTADLERINQERKEHQSSRFQSP